MLDNGQKSEKTRGELLKEKLAYNPKPIFDKVSTADLKKAEAFAAGYMKFLDEGKTERESVDAAVKMAEEAGFVPFKKGVKLSPGDKVYLVNAAKSVYFFVMGNRPLGEGILITAAHVDSPRLDLKPRPITEEHSLAYFKTHYYGGIKKYQWMALPLSLHGVICKKDGSSIKVSIGDDPGDPVFTVTDLLPHLAKEQMKLPMSEGIKGENMNVLIGSAPFADEKASEKVKLNILNILYEKYDIIEEDLMSAELELVPALPAREVGLDRSMIGAYGQDDRVCAYTALRGIIDAKKPDRSLFCVLADKEEVGSDGNTSIQSMTFKSMLSSICDPQGADYRDLMRNSMCLSADVTVAFDPIYPEVCDPKNTAYINCGVALMKYTGSGGKGGTSDANAEYIAKLRNVFDRAGVVWQMGELGKVDAGGGGTVAKFIANLGVETIDIGVPVLSMHSPFEVVSKQDVYAAYRAFVAFGESNPD